MGEKFFVENYLEHLFLRKMLLYAALFCLLALDHSVSGQGANGQVGYQQILCMFSCGQKPPKHLFDIPVLIAFSPAKEPTSIFCVNCWVMFANTVVRQPGTRSHDFEWHNCVNGRQPSFFILERIAINLDLSLEHCNRLLWRGGRGRWFGVRGGGGGAGEGGAGQGGAVHPADRRPVLQQLCHHL